MYHASEREGTAGACTVLVSQAQKLRALLSSGGERCWGFSGGWGLARLGFLRAGVPPTFSRAGPPAPQLLQLPPPPFLSLPLHPCFPTMNNSFLFILIVGGCVIDIRSATLHQSYTNFCHRSVAAIALETSWCYRIC